MLHLVYENKLANVMLYIPCSAPAMTTFSCICMAVIMTYARLYTMQGCHCDQNTKIVCDFMKFTIKLIYLFQVRIQAIRVIFLNVKKK